MVRSQKSKRVSWPSDVNLCQIRLFLSEDSPSQVGLGAQDNLQVKASWLLHSAGVGFDDQWPPGFEGAHSMEESNKEVSQIVLVKWQCPPRLVPNQHWQVVAGEESKEAEVQNQREMRVLEAIYPRPSAIPPSPSVSLKQEEAHYEDDKTPLIPITPIEDEDMTHSSSSDSVASTNSHVSSEVQAYPQSLDQGVPHKLQNSTINAQTCVSTNNKSVPGVEPDIVAAASAAFTAIMRSNEQGSLIDHELLIKILNNPKLIEKLVTDYGTSAKPQTASLLPVTPSGPPPPPGHFSTPMSVVPTTAGLFHPLVTNSVTPTLHPLPPSHPGSVKIPPPVKDINYYKSLIQQHGGEKAEAQEQTLPQFVNQHHLGTKTETLQHKSKNKRPCIYYNSSRGCKNGVNCAFQHDISTAQQRIPESQSSKRMKLDRELTGRT